MHCSNFKFSWHAPAYSLNGIPFALQVCSKYIYCSDTADGHGTPSSSWWGRKLPWKLWPWPCDLDLRSLTLTYDIRPCPSIFDLCDFDTRGLDLGPPFLILGLQLEFLHFWPWWSWPWPLNSSEIWCSLTCVLNFRSVIPMIQPAECKRTDRQTHTQTLYRIYYLFPLTRAVKMAPDSL